MYGTGLLYFSIHFRYSPKIENFPSTNPNMCAYYITDGFPTGSPFNSRNATSATWTKVKVIGDRIIPFSSLEDPHAQHPQLYQT